MVAAITERAPCVQHHYHYNYNTNTTAQSTSRVCCGHITAEIKLNKRHVVSSESQSSAHKQEISFDALLKAALRHRPDRIILGEVRGSEARTLLDAMNTGHDGTLTTIHASSADGALRRLAALAVRASGQMTIRDAEEEVRQSIAFVLQMARQNGRRRVITLSNRSSAHSGSLSSPATSS